MVKLTGPAHSEEARGALGEALIFSKSARSIYAKKHAKPSNPRTPKQISARAIAAFLAKQWSTLSVPEQQTWSVLADRSNISEYHAYMQINLPRWKNWLAPTRTMPPDPLAPPPGNFSFSLMPRVASINVYVTQLGPPNPWGYAIHHAAAAAPAPNNTTVIAIIPKGVPIGSVYLHTPLAAGIHYYRITPIGPTGVKLPTSGPKWTTIT